MKYLIWKNLERKGVQKENNELQAEAQPITKEHEAATKRNKRNINFFFSIKEQKMST